MAESDAAGPAPADDCPRCDSKAERPTTLAIVQRDVERSLAPLRAAQIASAVNTAPIRAAAEAAAKALAPFQEMERQQRAIFAKATAPIREMERQQKAMVAALDAGIGRTLREMFGQSARTASLPPPAEKPADSRTAETPPLSRTAAPVRPSPAAPLFNVSREAMSALVERVAEEVVKRLEAQQSTRVATAKPPQKSRRGRKCREISVGGPDAALEALAEEDPSVMALAARDLVKKGIPYCRRTIENCDTYKAWRRGLETLRLEAAAEDMADVLDAGLARIQKKKPGRMRLVDPTIDPVVEKMTKEFIRLHGEKGLGGQ